MSREFVYSVLSHPELEAFVGERVLQQSSMLSGQTVKPYIVYTMGNNTDEGMSDPDVASPCRQFFQAFFHDEVGDYSRIDQMMEIAKRLFLTAELSGDVCGVLYLESSRDLDDPTLQTNMRYMRFQLAKTR